MSEFPPQADPPAAAATFSPVVIAPVYNHAAALAGVLNGLAALNLPILIVNDGSTDDTAAVAASWAAAHGHLRVKILTHRSNRGKAAALRTGFAWAAAHAFTHAATIDTDGQLDPEQIPDLLHAARQSPDALVLGRRDETTPALPRANLIGWYTSALGLRLETRLAVRDSQCGLRVYPLKLTEGVKVRAHRFGYEAEIIARAAWTGFDIVEVPVNCHYALTGRRESHFRPWLDGARGFLMHARLTLRRLNPWPIHRLAPSRLHPPAATALHRAPLADQFNPRVLLRGLCVSRLDQLFIAAACGIGTFMAALPLGGWQLVAALYAGLRFHVHFIPLAMGTALAYAGTDPYLQGLGLAIGHFLIHAHRPPDSFWPLGPGFSGGFVIERLVGGVIVGFFCNWVVIGGLVGLFRLIPLRQTGPQVPARRENPDGSGARATTRTG